MSETTTTLITAAIVVPLVIFLINWKSARILRRFVEAYHRDEVQDVGERLRALGDAAADV